MSVGGGGGGYSGGGGGFSGGFGPPPMFGGGFGQQFPSYGGGFGAFGPQPYGGFGGGFGMPQQPQYGGGFGGGFGQPQPPQFGGGFGQFQPPQFGGGFGQRGPGNAYARPFPTQQPNQPPPGMELNPNYYDRFANGQIGTMDVRPSDDRFRPIQQPNQPPPGMELNPDYIPPGRLGPAVGDTGSRFRPIQGQTGMDQTPTGGGYPSRDQFNQTFQLMPAVMPEVPTGGGYPSRDQSSFSQFIQPTMIEPIQAQQGIAVAPSAEKQQVDEIMKRSFTNPSSVTAEDRAVLQKWEDGASARSAQNMQVQMQAFRQRQLGGGLGGVYGGYQAMPFGGYRTFPF